MPSSSTPFKSKAPFHSRVLGLNYEAFGLDFINPPFVSKFGCLKVVPSSDWTSYGPEGGPFHPAATTYTVSNIGGTPIDWTVGFSETWLTTDTLGGTLDPGESQTITVELEANSLTQDPSPYVASILWTNTTNNCGTSSNLVNLYVSGNLTLDIEYRTHGGGAVLIGCSELTSPSTPPRKYRRAANSGTTITDGWLSAGCPGPADTTLVCDYTRWRQYDAVTGALTTGGATDCSDGAHQTFPIECLIASDFISDCSHTWTITQTEAARHTTGVCCQPGIDWIRSSSDTLKYTLSDEDLESDAIARLLAGSSYTAWTAAASFGIVMSEYQSRTSFGFIYRVAQYRLTRTGLAPSTAYTGSATVYRRAWGTSNPWMAVSTTAVSGTTDGSGNFTFTATLPNAVGYEYSVWNASLNP